MTEIQPHSQRRAGQIALTMGLLAISALLTMAFASAASAAPTAFCKAAEDPCSVENTYPAGTTFKAVAEDFEIESHAIHFDCGEATIELSTTQSVGEPLNSELKNLSLKNCTSGYPGAGSCYVEKPSLNKYSKPAIDRVGPGEGIALPFGASWKWTCSGGGSCCVEGTFDSRGAEVPYGAEEFIFNETPIECSGALCSGNPMLTAHFEIVSPQSVYLAEGTSAGTTLCKAAEKYCAGSNIYPAETTLKASAEKPVKIHTSYGNVECSSSTLEALTLGAQGNPLEVLIEPIDISGSCSDSITWANSCTVKTEEGAGGAYGLLSWSSANNGSLALEPSLWFTVTCAVDPVNKVSCEFQLVGEEGIVGSTLVGGNPAHIDIRAASLGESGGWLCPEDGKSTLEANYTVTSPKPIYISR